MNQRRQFSKSLVASNRDFVVAMICYMSKSIANLASENIKRGRASRQTHKASMQVE